MNCSLDFNATGPSIASITENSEIYSIKKIKCQRFEMPYPGSVLCGE